MWIQENLLSFEHLRSFTVQTLDTRKGLVGEDFRFLDKELVGWVEREAGRKRRSRSSLIEIALAKYREDKIKGETKKMRFISTRPLVRA